MTNAGVNGWPGGASGMVADGSITPGKLAAPGCGFGRLYSGRYYFPAGTNSTPTSSTLGVGTLRVYPWVVPHVVTLSVIGSEVTSAGDSGSKLRLGVFADNGTCFPGSLVLDAGTIAGDSATVQDIAVNLTLQPGLYWIGGAVQVVSVTQPTVRSMTLGPAFPIAVSTTTPGAGTAVNGHSQTSVTGALPGVFSSTISGAGSAPRLHVKVA